MKKKVSLVLAVALVLTMLFTFASCGGGSGLKTGYYTISEMSMEGMTLSGDQLEAFGMDPSTVYIKIDGNGKGEISLAGDATELTYNDKEMIFEDDPAEYTYENDTITIEQDGAKMKFKFDPNFKG